MPLRVKIERVCTFLRFVYSHRTHLTHHIIRSFYGTGKGAMRGLDVSTDKRKRRRQLHGGDLAHTGNLCRNDLLPRCIHQFRRTTKMVDKTMGEINCARPFATGTDKNCQKARVRDVSFWRGGTHKRLARPCLNRQILDLQRLSHAYFAYRALMDLGRLAAGFFAFALLIALPPVTVLPNFAPLYLFLVSMARRSCSIGNCLCRSFK